MDIDVFDPAIYEQRGVPYEDFRRLRVEHPVYFHREAGGRGYWAITKYRDIVAISRDPATFSSHRGATFIKDYDEGSDELTAMRFMMVNMDPPQHVKFRNLVRHGFIPKMVSALEPRIRQRVRTILDNIAEKGECDFLTEVAWQLPLEVIAEMLGIPDRDRAMVFEWSDRMVSSIGGEDAEVRARAEDGNLAAMQMYSYAGELAQERYDKPGEDLISVLMHGAVDGEQITPMEFASFFMLLVVAGNETTRSLIANGMLTLLDHPDQRNMLIANPSLTAGAVEEILRWSPAIVYFRRTATRDVELRGQKIREGDKLALYYPSANRDEEMFPDPDRFDIRRSPNDHLAFGIGQHVCLGASLARLEIRVLFEELLARFPEMELAGPVRRMRSNFVNGIKSMPVCYRPEKIRRAV